jgi:hypothetical protein
MNKIEGMYIRDSFIFERKRLLLKEYMEENGHKVQDRQGEIMMS